MKKRIIQNLAIIVLVLANFLSVEPVKADNDPVLVNCVVDKLSISEGDTVSVLITIKNPKQFDLTNVAINYEGQDFSIEKSADVPSSISPFSSYKGLWTLKSKGAGTQTIVFSIAYSWQDTIIHSEIFAVTTQNIEINPPVSIRWPDYLLPLIIGLVASQSVSWITNWINYGKEKKKQEEQVRGILLAILHSAKKAVENQSKVSFGLWEDVVIKSNLIPAIYRLGEVLKKPDITKRLASLSNDVEDYNQRYDQNNITGAIRVALSTEIDDLINVLDYVD